MNLLGITRHVKDQNWFAVVIELFIVVIGVFLGMQVSDWSEQRQKAKMATGYLVRIEAEIGEEMSRWEQVREYYDKTRRHGIAALDAYAMPVDSLGVEFLVDLFQASQRINVLSNRATYDELVATGRIGNVASDSVRKQLINYYRRVDSLDMLLADRFTYRRTVRLYMDHTIQSQILEKCGDIYIEAYKSYYVRLPEECEISVEPELLRAEISKLYENSEVKQELRFHVTILRGMLTGLANTDKISVTTLEKIRSAENPG